VTMGGLERVILLPFAAELDTPYRSGRNKAAILSVLDFLGGLTPAGNTDLPAAARQLAKGYPTAGLVLVLSDLLNSGEGLSEALAWLKSGDRDVVVLHTYSATDADPTLAGPTLLRWSEGPDRLNLDISEDLLTEYRRSWHDLQEAIRHNCIARAATYVPAPTNVPMEELLLKALRRAGVLAD